MNVERRRQIFEKVTARLQARGLAFDDSPLFTAELERWIVGEIDLKELQSRYHQIKRPLHDHKNT